MESGEQAIEKTVGKEKKAIIVVRFLCLRTPTFFLGIKQYRTSFHTSQLFHHADPNILQKIYP